MEFDEAVDGFGAAVAGSGRVEVAQERVAPLVQGPAQAGDLGDGTRWERLEEVFCDCPSCRVVVLVVGGADQLSALPCDFDGYVAFVGRPRPLKSVTLAVGEVLFTGVQDVADPVERVVFASAVTMDVVLRASAYLVDGLGGEFDDVERVMPTSA